MSMTRRMISLLILIAGALSAADVSGTWEAAVETGAGSGNPTFVLKQDGEKLTGTYSGALGEAKLVGVVKGNSIEFMFEVAPQGDKVQVNYKGAIKSATEMSGTLAIPGLGEGTWSAKKRN